MYFSEILLNENMEKGWLNNDCLSLRCWTMDLVFYSWETKWY
jgi:hypothetical protein